MTVAQHRRAWRSGPIDGCNWTRGTVELAAVDGTLWISVGGGTTPDGDAVIDLKDLVNAREVIIHGWPMYTRIGGAIPIANRGRPCAPIPASTMIALDVETLKAGGYAVQTDETSMFLYWWR